MQDPRRHTPAVDAVLSDPRLATAIANHGRTRIKALVRAAVKLCREGSVVPDQVVETVLLGVPVFPGSMRPVINATGVVIHTNLGRAPLSATAIEAVRIAAGVTPLEFDLTTGGRSQRGRGALEALAGAVPQAGAVHVVNNGAGALALVASTLAGSGEIVIARGELVEIGDGFRIFELLESVGARVVAVGATNRVRLSDYADAITPETGLILKVHPSNFQITGFTSAVAVADLAPLPVPVVVDIGSGLLTPHQRFPDEPDATTMLRAGADVVTASGDKLLGGPQAGLMMGRRDLIERLRRHPLARAVRADKLTLAALEVTLTGPPTPTATALATDQSEFLERAQRIVTRLSGIGDALAVPSHGAVGGGSAPGVALPSAAVSVPVNLVDYLRRQEAHTPIVGRVEARRLLLDLIAVDPGDDELLITAVSQAFSKAAK